MKDIIWLVCFALTIMAILVAMSIMVPQKTQTAEIRNEPTLLEEAARGILNLTR
jgi:hypothetical protein